MKRTFSTSQNPGLQASCVLVTCLILPFVFSGDAASLESSRSSGHVEAVISDISYEGGESYRIEITIMNRSSKGVIVERLEREISVQTDDGFAALDRTDGDRASAQFALAATEERRINTGVKIPIGTKGLFRTFEGDVSLMFSYRLQLASERETVRGESYYWLTPMTGRWLLREGM